MSREHLFRERGTGIALGEIDPRARYHNVIIDRNGVVHGRPAPDIPSDEKNRLKRLLDQMLNDHKVESPRMNFVPYQEKYRRFTEEGQIEEVVHGVNDGLAHVTTSGRVV